MLFPNYLGKYSTLVPHIPQLQLFGTVVLLLLIINDLLLIVLFWHANCDIR